MERFYGFQFFGEKSQKGLFQTSLPVDQAEFDYLIAEVLVISSQKVGFKPLFGIIKELSIYKGKILSENYSKFKNNKYRAFILKRKGDIIICEQDNFYFVNGRKIDMSFGRYDVIIVDY